MFVALISAAPCGKRGNPLAPLVQLPAAVTQVAARRVGDRVEIRFNVPSENADHTTPPALAKVQIFAAAGPASAVAATPMSIPPVPLAIPINGLPVIVNSTALLVSRFPPVQLAIPPGFATPAKKKGPAPDVTVPQITVKKHLRGEIAVRPAPEPVEGEAAAPAAPVAPPSGAAEDTRPLPGATATFSEQVPAERAAAAQSSDASILRYVVVGVTAAKRLGMPSPILEIPLTAEVLPPRDAAATYDETLVKLTWTPTGPSQSFRVYRSDPAGKEEAAPLNPLPLAVPLFTTPVEFGTTRCFVIRSVVARGAATTESDPAGPVCVEAKDTFPPPAPTGLSLLPTENQVQLLWTPVTAADLAGYVVLRSENGAPATPLMTQPIADATYADATVKAGSRYTYTVVAVDKAGNRSQPSNAVDEIR
jgi:hypothetical protein